MGKIVEVGREADAYRANLTGDNARSYDIGYAQALGYCYAMLDGGALDYAPKLKSIASVQFPFIYGMWFEKFHADKAHHIPPLGRAWAAYVETRGESIEYI